MRATGYIILEASTTKELESVVRAHIEEGWKCSGGPFTYTWAAGHGPVANMPEPHNREWMFFTFCQAMES